MLIELPLFFKAPYIIFAPISPSKINAIQWSTDLNLSENALPAKKPSSGITPWKTPKKAAIIAASFFRKSFKHIPLVIEIATASIASPTAMQTISISPIISSHGFCYHVMKLTLFLCGNRGFCGRYCKMMKKFLPQSTP